MKQKTKKSDYLFSLYALAAMSENISPTESENNLTDRDTRDLKDIAERKIKKRRGLTEFKYGSNSIWALNRKNADRKAKQKGLYEKDQQD